MHRPVVLVKTFQIQKTSTELSFLIAFRQTNSLSQEGAIFRRVSHALTRTPASAAEGAIALTRTQNSNRGQAQFPRSPPVWNKA